MFSTSNSTLSPRRGAFVAHDANSDTQALGPWRLSTLVAETPLYRIYRASPAQRGDGDEDLYAVKLLRDEWQTNPQAAAMLRREAAVGQAISHPHLVPVLSARLDDWPPYIVMPFLSGMTLDTRLASGWRPTADVALWIARQVAEGLDALYQSHKWMHCDIKPANILLADDGHATLLDFGLVRSVGQEIGLVDRVIAGTLNYMAPEMISSSLAPDIRSDLYSLGVTLYQLISGRLPFDHDNPAELAALKRNAAPRRLVEFAPQVSADVAQLIYVCLSREPLRRPQSPAELIEWLARLEIAHFAKAS